MALPQIGTKAEPQIIPTNAGLRTWAVPPEGLQDNIVPNDLIYIPNHWKDSPEIDINTFTLKIDGEVEREITLSFEDLKKLPQKRFQVTFECWGIAQCPSTTPKLYV